MSPTNEAGTTQPVDVLLSEWMQAAFAAVCPDAAVPAKPPNVVATASAEHGDYQCNDAMGLAKTMRAAPRDIAARIVKALPANGAVEGVDVAGPGFINIRLSSDWLGPRVEAMMADARLGVPPAGQGRTVVMDYGSPNMSKPLHVGHLRSANIGAALDRMLRFLSYRVISDNHLGDWGTQFGVTIMGYRSFGDEAAMVREPMEELERVYVKSYDRAKQDEEWMRRCREELVKLQAGDPENTRLWRRFMEMSLVEVGRIYRRIGVTHDIVRGESHYNDRLAGVVDTLERRGVARLSEGALAVFLEEEGLPVALVRKSDGGYNYMTTDIATVMSRAEEFKPDLIIYLTDERQQLHFKQLFAICRRLGIDVAMEHIWFGLMRLPEGTFSTREGNVIKLDRLLDEAENRALAVVQSQSPEMESERQKAVARAVGIGAVKYADLSQNPQSVVTFTWEKALALTGNSAPYLQYACARIASVRDKYRERFPDGVPERFPIRIAAAEERALAIRIARFPEVLLRAASARKPNVLADYLYDLAQAYSTYYQNVPFLKAEEGVRESRVRLCGGVATVLRKGLELLGIETPERI